MEWFLLKFQEHFVFPEIDNNEELDELNQMVEPIEKFFVHDCKSFYFIFTFN